jgi:hypothetical protein
MKKLFAFVLLGVLASSCQEDIQFNNPGFQGYRDDILFRGIDNRAYLTSGGSLNLEGLAQDEQLNITLPNATVGTYYFGTTDQSIKAAYSSTFNGIELDYATNLTVGPVATIQKPLLSQGSGYTTQSGVLTSGGSGVGLLVRVTADASGLVTDVKLSSPGNNYAPGDIITVMAGDENCTFRVQNVENSNGEVTITSNDGNTISGKFKFNAISTNQNPLGNPVVNFQFGEFYKVPIVPQP